MNYSLVKSLIDSPSAQWALGQRHREHAPDAAGAVDWEGLDGVVDFKLREDLRRHAVHEAADEAHEDGAAWVDAAAPRRDGHKA